MDDRQSNIEFLECEKKWIFAVLIAVGGFYGAYTYTIRGGVFCNAQTANFVIFAMALGNANWMKALYYLIPMSAYLFGTIISELLASSIKKYNLVRWDTILIGIEIVIVLALGFLPETAPYQICQVAINFICSMQYNTFRQAQKIPMATTFCTNHLRQVGIHLAKWFRKREEIPYLKRSIFHTGMLLMFVIGGVISAILCKYFLGKAIWGAVIPLLIVFIDLLHADLTKERKLLHRIPYGH